MILTLDDVNTIYSFFKENVDYFTKSKPAIKNLIEK